jgi:hypothetical protein
MNANALFVKAKTVKVLVSVDVIPNTFRKLYSEVFEILVF